MRPLTIGVTGTDTGVGKTVVACALVAALAARGRRVAPFKPVETGVEDREDATDALALLRASGDRTSLEEVCPIIYGEPLAPWVAAERVHRPVDFARLDEAFATLQNAHDAVVVEGAGGLLAPFDRTTTFADLAAIWGLDLVIVAANRLGVINHTMLTLLEARRRGLAVRAVVLNAITDVDDLAAHTNVDALQTLIAPVPLVTMPFLPHGARAWTSTLASHGARLAALCDPADG